MIEGLCLGLIVAVIALVWLATQSPRVIERDVVRVERVDVPAAPKETPTPRAERVRVQFYDGDLKVCHGSESIEAARRRPTLYREDRKYMCVGRADTAWIYREVAH